MNTKTVSVTDGKAVAELIGGLYLNCNPYGHRAFYELMALQNLATQHNFTVLCLAWFQKLAQVDYFDERNEHSIAQAKLLAHIEPLPCMDTDSKGIPLTHTVSYVGATGIVIVLTAYMAHQAGEHDAFLAQMLSEHKTLQQNFSRFCMRWFEVLAEKNPESQEPHVHLAKEIIKHRVMLPYI